MCGSHIPQSRHRPLSGDQVVGRAQGASAFGNFECWRNSEDCWSFPHSASLNNHGLPKMVTRFPRGLFIQHHTAIVTWNGVARHSAPDLTAYHYRLCESEVCPPSRLGQPLLGERCDCLGKKHAFSLCALEADPTPSAAILPRGSLVRRKLTQNDHGTYFSRLPIFSTFSY